MKKETEFSFQPNTGSLIFNDTNYNNTVKYLWSTLTQTPAVARSIIIQEMAAKGEIEFKRNEGDIQVYNINKIKS